MSKWKEERLKVNKNEAMNMSKLKAKEMEEGSQKYNEREANV